MVDDITIIVAFLNVGNGIIPLQSNVVSSVAQRMGSHKNLPS
jgi:hypothetical protein